MIDNRRLVMTAMALACLAVAGCGKKAAEGNKATGEVLEGTISDAMIAPDRVHSEPPIAPRQTGTPDAKGGDRGKPKPADDTAAPDASPTPETSPAVEPSPALKTAVSEPAG